MQNHLADMNTVSIDIGGVGGREGYFGGFAVVFCLGGF